MSDYGVLGLMSMQSFRRVLALVLPLALACLLAAALLLGLAVSAARAGGVIVVGVGCTLVDAITAATGSKRAIIGDICRAWLLDPTPRLMSGCGRPKS